ncbi:nitrate- and nitrite sensing domain-containing protein [Actinokineospora sp.]|uniref:nitrate- and nitrite sensing domain-containing protein n=1 Tax=Actinokineospora sp. TaxID=1872133 RepID=UPI004037993D
MIFRRLLVREKLNLLAIVPLVAIVTTAVPLVAIQINDARQSAAVASRIDTAARFGRVVRELERERLLAIVYLGLPEGRTAPLVTQSETVRDGVADARAAMGKLLTPRLAAGLAGVDALDGVRAKVLDRSVTGSAVNTEFTQSITAVIDSFDLVGGPRERGLLALVQAGERSSSAAAEVLVAVGDPSSAAAAATSVSTALAVERTQLAEFDRLASPEQRGLLGQAERGPAARQVAELQARFLADPAAFATSSAVDTLLPQVYSAVDSRYRLRGLVQDKIADDLAAAAADEAEGAIVAAVVFSTIAIGLVIAILALSVAIGRSVSRPLRRLTLAADRVSELANAELVRVADEDADEQVAPRLAAVDVRTEDEIGDLAAAINRVQAVAALLLERQVVSRRNVAVMFGNVGRRTQNLVGRQLSLIDSLERNEQDTELLQRLYRLDHLSSRLRRNANSLLVLSGAVEQQLGASPQLVGDLARSALGEIEDFQRVVIGRAAEVRLKPDATSDVTLLLAELMENATSFSPPTTQVHVTAVLDPDGCRVFVIDHGIGMAPDQLAQENDRLVSRERLDIAPTNVLGLFVVGRLARRHGIEVTLHPTREGGVTAEILLPPALLVSSDAPVAPVARSDRPVPAVSPAESRLVSTAESRPDRAVAPPAPPRSDRVPAAAAPLDRVAATSRQSQSAGPAIAGLNRRVRGAQLPKTERTDGGRPRWEPADSPDAARALVEQFESGVQRANRLPEQPHAAPARPVETSAPQAPQAPPARSAKPPMPAEPAAARGKQADPGPPTVQMWVNEFRHTAQLALDTLASMSDRRNGDGEPSPPTWFTGGAERAAQRPAAQHSAPGASSGGAGQSGPPPPGAEGLRRRVRGASLPEAAKRTKVRIGQPDDPEAARDLVLDFEAGIDRATRDIGQHRKPEETSS